MAQYSTKSKILSAAVDLFASRGYADSTVAVICEQANVNIAAINYHFGSKESLFQEVLSHSFEQAEVKYPLKSESYETPDDQLRWFITAIIRRTFDDGPAGRIDQILSHEVVREDGPHNLIVNEVQERQGQVLRTILSKILQTRSTKLLNQAHVNVAALCFFPKIALPLRKMLFPHKPSETQLQNYIDGQVEFALSGLSALKPSSINK